VLPDEQGFCCFGDVDAVEEEADLAGRWEGFVGAFGG